VIFIKIGENVVRVEREGGQGGVREGGFTKIHGEIISFFHIIYTSSKESRFAFKENSSLMKPLTFGWS